MEILWSCCGIALLGAALAPILRRGGEGMTVLFLLAAGLAILWRIVSPLQSVFYAFSGFLAEGQTTQLYQTALKAAGAALLVHLTAAQCKDAGAGALAAQLELAGVITVVWLALPLVMQLFELLSGWLA